MSAKDDNCTCTWEDYGDGETGPRPYLTPDEACPLHGREANPEEWAESDAMERGWLMSGVGSLLKGRGVSFPKEYEDLTMKLYEVALSVMDDGEEDDGHDGDRALGNVADALVALMSGRQTKRQCSGCGNYVPNTDPDDYERLKVHPLQVKKGDRFLNKWWGGQEVEATADAYRLDGRSGGYPEGRAPKVELMEARRDGTGYEHLWWQVEVPVRAVGQFSSGVWSTLECEPHVEVLRKRPEEERSEAELRDEFDSLSEGDMRGLR